jgi:hypothetical protein
LATVGDGFDPKVVLECISGSKWPSFSKGTMLIVLDGLGADFKYSIPERWNYEALGLCNQLILGSFPAA